MIVFRKRKERETSIEADLTVLFMEIEGLLDGIYDLESRFDKLANDIRELKLKVKP